MFRRATSRQKAVKALDLHFEQEACGHVVAKLLSELPASVKVSNDLLEKGMVLDNFYMPTRYANGHPEGVPFEHYGSLQRQQAITYASEIIEFVRAQMT